MKKLILFTFILFYSCLVYAQNSGGSKSNSSKISDYKTNDKLLETLGVMSAQSMYTTYTSIGALADAYVKGSYTKEDAQAMITFNIGLMESLSKSLADLLKTNRLTGEDVNFVKEMIKVFNELNGEATALKHYIESENSSHLTTFDQHRQAAWAKISELLGIE